MPKVYLVNHNPSHDYSSAEAFGELVCMTEGVIPHRTLHSKAATFDAYAKNATEEDFLLLSGTNLVSALAVLAWSKHHPRFTILQYGPYFKGGQQTQTHFQFIVDNTGS